MLELDERGDRAMGFVLRNSFLVVALVLFLAVAAAAAAVPAGAEMAAANAYNGSFSMQWHAAEEEWALDSETSRRILLYSSKSGHIDYNAIKDRNAPAVSAKSGQPYKRGCLKIYHCPGRLGNNGSGNGESWFRLRCAPCSHHLLCWNKSCGDRSPGLQRSHGEVPWSGGVGYEFGDWEEASPDHHVRLYRL